MLLSWETVNLEGIDESYPYPKSHHNFYNETKALSEKLVREYNGRGGLENGHIKTVKRLGSRRHGHTSENSRRLPQRASG